MSRDQQHNEGEDPADAGALFNEQALYLELLCDIRHHRGTLQFAKVVVDWSTVKALRAQVGQLCVLYLVSGGVCQFLTPRFGWEYARHCDVINGKAPIGEVRVLENEAARWYAREIRDMREQTTEHIMQMAETLSYAYSMT